MIKLISSAILLLSCSTLSHSFSPPIDARTYFSAEFYRRVVNDLKKKENDIALSPAATQKLLVALYIGIEDEKANRFLSDIGLKHYYIVRWRQEFYKEMNYNIRQLSRMPIYEDEVIQYFENDFKGTSSFINVENYIVVPENLTPKPDYQKFAKEYFNVDVVNAKTDVDEGLQTKFGIKDVASDQVQLYSEIVFNLTLANSGSSSDGNLQFNGAAKYFEDENAQYIELDLENGLKLFIAAFNETAEFEYYISQRVRRITIKDYEQYFADNWGSYHVEVKIPAVNFENVNDLAVTLRKISKQVSHSGLKHVLVENAELSEAVENWPETGPKVEHFWQHVAVKIQASAEHVSSQINNEDLKPKTFNAVGKTFFYAIKDDKVYYAMGSHIAEKTNN